MRYTKATAAVCGALEIPTISLYHHAHLRPLSTALTPNHWCTLFPIGDSVLSTQVSFSGDSQSQSTGLTQTTLDFMRVRNRVPPSRVRPRAARDPRAPRKKRKDTAADVESRNVMMEFLNRSTKNVAVVSALRELSRERDERDGMLKKALDASDDSQVTMVLDQLVLYT